MNKAGIPGKADKAGSMDKAPFLHEFARTASNMYRLGWDERNGGNLSLLLEEEDVKPYLSGAKVNRRFPLGFGAKELAGKYFLMTGTTKYFKNVEGDEENNLGLFRISADGTEGELFWGYKDGGSPTSELPAHLMTHIVRRRADPANRVVLHCHPTDLLSMTYVHKLDSAEFTHTLWQMSTECIVVFPDGVEVLPWMVCGTREIGEATAERMKDARVVVWAMHGVYGAGRTLDEAFGLIETVEKAASVYMRTAHLPRINTIRDSELKLLAARFGVTYRKGIID